jgi:hypothetical protein
MSKLCQIVAVEKSVKNKAHQGLTEAYQKVQKSALLTGISRVYRPNDESGEQLPAESTRVQLNAQDVLKDVAKVLTELFDVTACKDYTNCFAHADVSVGEVVLAKDVPITYLLFLEKKLTDIHTFVSKLPTLDPSEEWTFDSNVGAFVSKPSETVKTKKVFVPLLLSPATDKHPAQVKGLIVIAKLAYFHEVKSKTIRITAFKSRLATKANPEPKNGRTLKKPIAITKGIKGKIIKLARMAITLS